MSEQNRRRYRNELYQLIKDCNTNISRSQSTINRLKQQSGTSDSLGLHFSISQIDKLKESIENNTQKLKSLEEELKLLNYRQIDDKIDKKYEKQSSEVSRKRDLSVRIKKDLLAESNKNKEVSEKYNNNMKKIGRQNRKHTRDINYSWKRFCNIVDTIPSYIKRNLKDMPNNKGYIWKGVWLFGDNKANSDTLVMFEKRKGKILIIHEIDNKTHKIWEKKGKGKRILVSETPRRNINSKIPSFF